MNFSKLVDRIRGAGGSNRTYTKGKVPPGEDREAYFAHKKKNKRDPKKLTPLQKRMESGRA